MKERLILTGAPTVDVSKFVQWVPNNFGQRWRVGSDDSRIGQVGTALGNIALRHAGGYEVVLQLDNGKIDSFAPTSLLPETV